MSIIRKLAGPEQLIFLFVILVFTLTAYNSHGYFHADEHWQILEFASFKMGNIPGDQLAWEYRAQIRQAIQPAIVCQLRHILPSHTSPFAIILILRLLSAFGAITALFLCSKAMKISTRAELSTCLLVICCFWFIPLLCVRFSSENWSGICFSIAVFLMLLKDNSLRYWHYALIGLLLGFSFLFRIQSIFVIAGVFAWLIIVKKEKIANLSIIAALACVVVLFGVMIDKWFYGNWTFTPWNYFDVNILQDKAADFGTKPWSFYFIKIMEKSLFLDGIIILASLVAFVIIKPRHLLVWVIIPFLVGHVLIAHKELRFMFPLVYFVPFVVFTCADRLKVSIKKPLIICLLALNIPLVLVTATLPCHPSVEAIRAASMDVRRNKKVYYTEENPVNTFGLANSFYTDSLNNIEYIKVNPGEIVDFSTTQDGVYFYARLSDLEQLPPTIGARNMNPFLPSLVRCFAEHDIPGRKFLDGYCHYTTYELVKK